MNGIVSRVQAERRLRGWSQRDAAVAGGTSNQTWSKFELTGKITDAIQAAVPKAFDWSSDWSVNLPPLPVNELEQRLAAIEERLDRLEGDGGGRATHPSGTKPTPFAPVVRLPSAAKKKTRPRSD